MKPANGVLYPKALTFLYIVAISLCARASIAQTTCPFDSTAAIVDTLDFTGYYPLAIGNIWEYTSASGAFPGDPFRLTIVGDSLIGGETYFKFERISFERGSPIVNADTTFYYEHVNDTSIVQFSNDSFFVNGKRLASQFNSCYDDQGSMVEVHGGYEQPVTFQEENGDTTYIARGLKQFVSREPTERFAFGFGRVRSVGDPFVETNLVFGRVDGLEFGTPLDSLFEIRVSVEEPLYGENTALDIFPNPAKNHVTIRVAWHSTTSPFKLELVDLLGRTVAFIHDGFFQDSSYSYQLNTARLPSGIYLAALTTANGFRITSPVVVVH